MLSRSLKNGTKCSEQCVLLSGTVLFTCIDASFVKKLKKKYNQENAEVKAFVLCPEFNKTSTLQSSSVFEMLHRCGQVPITPFHYGV